MDTVLGFVIMVFVAIEAACELIRGKKRHLIFWKSWVVQQKYMQASGTSFLAYESCKRLALEHQYGVLVLQSIAETRPWRGLSHVSTFLRLWTSFTLSTVAGESKPPAALKECWLA